MQDHLVVDDPVVAPTDLLDLLRDVLGSDVDVAGVSVANRARGYVVLLIDLGRPHLRIVAKLAGPDAAYPCPFERTAAIHRLVRARTTIPVADVLAADVSTRRWPWRYLVTTFVEGRPWSAVRDGLDADGLAGAYRQVGDAVGQLHAITFPACGELRSDGPSWETGRGSMLSTCGRGRRSARRSYGGCSRRR